VSCRIEKQQAVSIEPESDDSGTEIEHEDELVEFVRRSAVNKVIKKKKHFLAHSRLLNFLRCKFFLKYRDAHLMNSMAWEARNWMLKNDFLCDNAVDYSIMALAVTGAFLVTREEMVF
jgi:hypothetical protein